jgi:hypothetical protein
MFTPGFHAFVGYSLEATTTSSYGAWDDDTPVLPALPNGGVPILAGFTEVPQIDDDYGSKKGFGPGSPFAVYNADGTVTHQISFDMRIHAATFLQHCVRSGSGLYGLPDLAIWVGVSNGYGRGWLDVYRFCKVNTLALNFREGSAQELTASVTLWGLARQPQTTLITPTREQIEALGSPLFWHDVRELDIEGTDYRRYVESHTINYSNNLSRTGIRPHTGHNDPLALTPYEITPGDVAVSGDTTFRRNIPATLLTDAVLSRRWGDMAINCSNAPAIPAEDTANIFNVTVEDVLPQRRSSNRTERSAPITHTVPWVATDMTIATA